jgi:hypothetical protein
MRKQPPAWLDVIKLKLLIRLFRLRNWIAGWGYGN